MNKCATCGNEYDKAFCITVSGQSLSLYFDSFECAIHALAPVCPQCGCKIIGHGVEERNRIYCCAHCARESGAHQLVDRAERAER